MSTALAAVVAALVLLPLLGHKPLAEWDEGIYAEVSREMLGGVWLIPHWNGQLWFEKPPLMLWITALFFKFFGVSEFWARAGSALSGVAIIALLHGFLARTRDLLTAWLSTIILLATFGFLHICHVGEMDVLLSLGVCLALIGLSELGRTAADTAWLLFWTGFAIALMTKGAASIVIPLTAIVVAIANRWPRRTFGRAFVIGLALFLALTVPWHLAMYLRFGQSFVGEYLGLHVLARATSQIEGHHTHWWYYAVVLLVSAPPFVLLYPVSMLRGWGRPDLRPWAIFAGIEILFFTLIQTRLPHYIAPVYPAFSVLTAIWIGDWLQKRWTQPRTYWLRTLTAAAVIWTVSVVATHSTLKSLHSADLAGPGLLDNKEADTLLRKSGIEEAPTPDPLLLWRKDRVQSIATVVFYARRPVQQVQLDPPPPGTPIDPYMFSPELLSRAVGSEPRLILLDKSLIPQIPYRFLYTPVTSLGNIELGTIVNTQR
jgi:4-amino-4-deoxy-L-arabinose transferase-like glycosyltransferase